MTATELASVLTRSIFLVIFAVVAYRAVRRPLRANIDVALLFGLVALILGLSSVADLLGFSRPVWLSDLIVVLLASLPYVMLRLVDDYSSVPRWLRWATPAALALIAVSTALSPTPLPAWLDLVLIAWFAGLGGYASIEFFLAARRSVGVTRRRMRAVAAGSVLVSAGIVAALVGLLLPGAAELLALATQLLGLTAGVAYFLGFTPPGIVRRTWQDPELRAFLESAAALRRQPDLARAVAGLEKGAARAAGVSHATIGLWNPEQGVLHYVARGGRVTDTPPDAFIGGRAFTLQRPIFTADTARDDPENAEIYRSRGANAVLAAPITADDVRYGVLCVYAERAPIFADDDLRLVQLLANQAAVVLESRALIDEAASMAAREEATRLKDDFLSAAAHDLRTPLTILLGQAELLERRAEREPDRPVDLERVHRIAREARRLRSLVQDLLDASRVEEGQLVANLETVDLAVTAADVCARHASDAGPCLLEAEPGVIGSWDRTRVEQLLDNLVENARKYSRQQTPVTVRVWREGDVARLSVHDEGIGIAPADLPHIFDRFYRGTNTDDRRYAGMGLGLFICRGIVEQHGGRIWVESKPRSGSTFHVSLPAIPVPAGADAHRTDPPAAGNADASGAGSAQRPMAHG